MGDVVNGPKPYRTTVTAPFERVPQCRCDTGTGPTFKEQAERIAKLEAVLRELSSKDIYLRHGSTWHDVQSLTRGVQEFARRALEK